MKSQQLRTTDSREIRRKKMNKGKSFELRDNIYRPKLINLSDIEKPIISKCKYRGDIQSQMQYETNRLVKQKSLNIGDNYQTFDQRNLKMPTSLPSKKNFKQSSK